MAQVLVREGSDGGRGNGDHARVMESGGVRVMVVVMVVITRV